MIERKGTEMPRGSMNIWRVRDRITEKRCPTCEARGRDPWHALDHYSHDAKRRSDVAVRCMVCVREDHAAYSAAHPEYVRRQAEKSIERDRLNPKAARAREKAYRERKKADGWVRRLGQWVRDGTTEE
jgi:hypothetical protein